MGRRFDHAVIAIASARSELGETGNVEEAMIKIILTIVVVLTGGVLILAATRPNTFRVRRAASIGASAEKIFPLINDFSKWGGWSPWEKKDPTMQRSLGAITSGKGAVYAWEGNKDVGRGRMEITDSVPPTRVVIRLDFIKPFEAHNMVEFTLEPTGDATNVMWTMEGHTPYLAKIIHLFLNMDRMVGRDFEAGLAGLKSIVEK